ncbi:MAG: phosphoglycerate kinase [Alphaproteobacteria bacterium]|nr:phosphoglycerate kinase [Alphaproteobacteria bacterium]HCO99909.1 phosphoglycerate kinase [Rhodospirillaceae bacterium]
MSAFRTLDDLDATGKRILLRADLNVPMSQGLVTDRTRLERVGPTILELADKGAKVIVTSHFGRPMGERLVEMSLAPVADELGAVLGRPVGFAADCIGDEAINAVSAMAEGDILVLENSRYHSGEETNDAAFSASLAGLAEAYVNDAFSAAHRAHASTDGAARLLPAYAGRLMQAELEALDRALGNPQRPVMAIVGGAKIVSKLELLGNLISRVDQLVIGGGMANTFLYAMGIDVGASLCEQEMADTARDILARAGETGCEVVLPSDVVIASEFRAEAESRVVPVDAVPGDQMILDVGPDSVASLAMRIAKVHTLVWNGPLGAFEIKPFDEGTVRVALAAAELTKSGTLLSVAGGGDTVAAMNHAGVVDDLSYVSAAGGAFLEWLEGKTLPGVAALYASAT